MKAETMTSIKDICELVWDLESRFDLLDWEVCGVKIWQYLRMPLYFRIAQETGVLDQPHSTAASTRDRLRALPRCLYAAVRKDPLRGRERVDALVFEHERSKSVDGRRIDIYTHYLQLELRNQGVRFHTLERPYLGRHDKSDSPDRFYLDRLILNASVQKRLMRVKVGSDARDLLQLVENEILAHTGRPIELLPRFERGIRHFKATYQQYIRLLEKRRPSRIYLVVSYGQGELIKAAKDLGIETVEIQHGAFSRYHLGYSFPERTGPLDYFPDTFYAWSDFWATMMPLPISKERIVNAGFPYMEQNRRRYRHVQRNTGQVLVLSQGSIGEKIAALVYQHRRSLDKYRIVYKLHPGEYDRWREYPSLTALAAQPNVRICLDEDLYALFAQSEYQMGVYSTAIYEGIEFGCRTVLLDLPGIEYMDHIRKRDDVCMFHQFVRESTAAPTVAPFKLA